MPNIHEKFDAIMAKLDDIEQRLTSLEQPRPSAAAPHHSPSKPLGSNPDHMNSAKPAEPHNPFTAPEAIPGNQAMRDKIKAMDTSDLGNLVKSFTFERDGRRDNRDVSNMEPELIQAAQDWDARGRPTLRVA